MPLTITCACGAHLEIDEKFVGQEIACPDCSRPLRVEPPPPRRHLRVSGLAVGSLIVGLVGFFTLVGSAVAIALGLVAQRRITDQSDRLTGVGFAHAGLAVGAAGIFATLGLLLAPDLLGLDVFVREFEWAGRLDYSYLATTNPPTVTLTEQNSDLSIIPPAGRWGHFGVGDTRSSNGDRFILVEVRQDAQLACQTADLDGDEDIDSLRRKAIDKFVHSDLVRLLSHQRGSPPVPTKGAPDREPKERDVKPAQDGQQEFVLDLRLGGHDRTFLLRVGRKGPLLVALVGGSRKAQFDRLRDQFRKAFDSFKLNQ